MGLTDFYQRGSRVLPAAHSAALVLAYAHDQEADVGALLRGAQVGEAAVAGPDTRITPEALLRLLQALASALPEDDTSFRFGQWLLPGHQGAISHALLQAVNLRQALELLVSHQARLSPLLSPRLMHLGGQTLLYWTDSCVTPRLRGFLVEMMMAAVTGMARWLADQRLPWRYAFNRTRPKHVEQYAVHLGPEVLFGSQLDAMAIDTHWLDVPWPRGSEAGCAMALAQAEREATDLPRLSLLAGLYDYLQARIRCAPSLEKTCADWGTSPATLKRHLAQHGTHFQAELDLVRTHVCLPLIRDQGLNNEQIAHYLGFHDANNFRRSFKRWTGLTPSGLRDQLLAAADGV